MTTIHREQKLTNAQLTRYLRSATCPYCGGRLSAHHTRSADGKNLPMTYRCTACGIDPRGAYSPNQAGPKPRPEGDQTVATKKTDKAPGKKNGGEQHDETGVTAKGRVQTIAKERPTPVTRKVAQSSEEVPDAAKIEATRAGKAKAKAPAATTDATPEQRDDATEIVVFAFRLTRGERDEIHAATGSAKASKFIRRLALAGARRDLKTIQETIDEVHTNRQ